MKQGSSKQSSGKQAASSGKQKGQGKEPRAANPNARSKAAIAWLFVAAIYFAFAVIFVLSALGAKHMSYALPFVTYGGTFKFSSLKWQGHTISLYWLMHGIGVVGMILMCLFRRRRFGYSALFSIITALLLAVFGYIGAKLLYIAENYSKLATEGITVNGVSFFGTVFFMPLVLPLIALIAQTKPAKYINFVTPAGLLMLIAIRTGCFFNGCCQGIQIWVGSRPLILPVQLIECVLDLCLMALLFTVEDIGAHLQEAASYASTAKKSSGDGSEAVEASLMEGKNDDIPLYPVFIGVYGLFRFFLEFIRATEKGFLGFSNGQWFALLAVIIGFFWLFTSRAGRKETENESTEEIPHE